VNYDVSAAYSAQNATCTRTSLGVCEQTFTSDESSRLKGLLQSDATGTLPTFGEFIAACDACQISKEMFSGGDDDDDKWYDSWSEWWVLSLAAQVLLLMFAFAFYMLVRRRRKTATQAMVQRKRTVDLDEQAGEMYIPTPRISMTEVDTNAHARMARMMSVDSMTSAASDLEGGVIAADVADVELTDLSDTGDDSGSDVGARL